MFVRESIAALADWIAAGVETFPRRVVLVSAGAGATRASLLTSSNGAVWRLEKSESDSALSGASMRSVLSDYIAGAVVSSLRRDPTESPEDDQRLHDAVDQLLSALQVDTAAEFRATLFGEAFVLPFSRAELGALVQPLAARFNERVRHWYVRFSRQAPVDAVLVWGDLLTCIDVEQTLRHTFSDSEVHVLSSHCVSRGVVRVMGLSEARELPGHAVSMQQRIPCLEGLWVPQASEAGRAGKGAVLVRLDVDEAPIVPIGDTLRIGRSPSADLPISPFHGEASNAHAVILRKGSLYVLADLNSTNGTYVNGRRVNGPTPLRDGDMIGLAVDGPRFRFNMSW